MNTVPSQAVSAAERPLPPHPSQHMTPARFAEWCTLLAQAAAERGLPFDPWPPP